MTIQEIIARIKDIKSEYVNNNITGDNMVEAIEDLKKDVDGNDGMIWDSDEDHYGSFEETDFSTLKIH